MDSRRVSLAFRFSAILLLASLAARAADIPPAEAFGTIPQVSHVELSPNGNLLAFYEVKQNASRVIMFDLAASKDRRAIPIVPPVKLRSITWADDETLLVTVSNVAAFPTG